MTENTNIENPELEDIRIPSYAEHGWIRPPKSLREHFETKRFGVFEIVPPCFDWNPSKRKIILTFIWGTDINDIKIPINKNCVEEHCWVPSQKGLKYMHPPREFNKMMKHDYPELWDQQQPTHEWEDNGNNIMLILSWDLEKYIKPKEI